MNGTLDFIGATGGMFQINDADMFGHIVWHNEQNIAVINDYYVESDSLTDSEIALQVMEKVAALSGKKAMIITENF